MKRLKFIRYQIRSRLVLFKTGSNRINKLFLIGDSFQDVHHIGAIVQSGVGAPSHRYLEFVQHKFHVARPFAVRVGETEFEVDPRTEIGRSGNASERALLGYHLSQIIISARDEGKVGKIIYILSRRAFPTIESSFRNRRFG